MYGYFLAYLAAPGTFDSAHVLELISGLPEAVKYSAKVLLAAPFTFHAFNGIRHLSWDVGKCMSGSHQCPTSPLTSLPPPSPDVEELLPSRLCCYCGYRGLHRCSGLALMIDEQRQVELELHPLRD